MKSGGGGGDELSLHFIILLLHGLLCVLTVMSEYTLDEPGFKAPELLHQRPLPRILLWKLLLRFAATV